MMDERPESRSAEARPCVDDFWRVYERQLEYLQAATFEWARTDPEFGPLLASLNAAQLLEARQRSLAILKSAMTGAWHSYKLDLRQEGAALAERGVGIHGWYQLSRVFRRYLLPHLVDEYRADPKRLTAAVEAMHELTDQSMAELVQACVDAKQAELRAGEQDLATTLDSIGDAVIVTDVEGRVTRMNPVAERLTGFTLAESRGKRLEEVFRIENEDTGAPVESPIRRVLSEGVVVGLANHTVLVARDGTRWPIADSGAPIRRDTGAIRGVVLVFRDVTDQRQAEESLRRWELVFKHACWGICLGSASNVRFAAVNPAYAEMHGYTVEELIGAPISIVWPTDTHKKMDAHTDEAREQGRLVAETIHVRKDGTMFPAEVVASTILDNRGKPVWFVANVQDVTERKRLQEARARAIELEAENRRVEEANRLKSEFLANMSHELRTPLNSIIGFTELIYDEQAGPLHSKQREFLEDILSSGQHLLRLINDVLDLAKIEAGKVDFSHEPVDLELLVQTVVQSLSAGALAKNIQVAVSVDPSLSDVELDPGRFKQVLYNYLSNALKFTPERGFVTVRIEPEEGNRFRLEVEDTGPGISAADKDRLFVAFQQLDSSIAKRYEGTGLGLALTKRLTEAQGGTVGVRSAPERGSIFFAVLPRRPGLRAGMLALHASGSEHPAVLVVEDNTKDRAVLVEILKQGGYDVSAVATCAEATEKWAERTYDAITLDLLVPDSRELRALLRKVHDDPRRPSVPVLAMTVVSDQRAAAGFPVDDVLTKPIDAQGVLAALERAGVRPSRGKPVIVVDDDVGSLKLMEATLAKLGYDALCFAEGSKALLAIEKALPLAVIVDLIMPEMDGFVFIERFRAQPENRRIPIMVWTVKDLTSVERLNLHARVHSIVEKGVGAGSPLSVALTAFLPTAAAGKGPHR